MTEKPQNKPQDRKLNKEIKVRQKKAEKSTIPGDNKTSIKQQEQIKKTEQKTEEKSIVDKEEKSEKIKVKSEENKVESKSNEQIPQKDISEKKEEKKTEAPKITKKQEAMVRGLNLHASKKHCMYICQFIKNKEIDKSLEELNEVIKMKKPIPFKGEIPHRSYPGMMSGRYPIKAVKQFIALLKGLRGNVLVNGLDLDNTRIYYASANWDSRPAKRGGMRFKRSYVILKAKEFPMLKLNQNKNKIEQESKK